MTDDTSPKYQPGDVANGHVLTQDGQWIPIAAAPAAAAPITKKRTGLKITGGIVGGLLVIGAISSIGNDDTATAAKDTSAGASASPRTDATTKVTDSDNDGFDDSEDAFPNDDREWLDENANGIGDNKDALDAKAREAAAQARAKARQAKQRAEKIAHAAAPSARTWAKVVRDPDAHAGEFYVIYGQITQFDSATGSENFLADTANRNTMSYGYFDGENTWLSGKARKLSAFVEDDVFKATVEVSGSYSYDTQIGGNTTVPEVKVVKMSRIG